MDYEKAYNEALERARKGMPIDEVFPEPKESEDERIRKALIRFFKNTHDWVNLKYDGNEIVAYLEKQKEPLTPEEKMNHPLYLEGFDVGKKAGEVLKEQQPAEWSEEDKKNRCPLRDDEIKVGDIITYFKDGKKGIMLVSSFDSGIYPRCKWGISHIDGTAYGDWAPGSGPYYAATEKEKQQLYDTMPKEIKDWLKSRRPQPQRKDTYYVIIHNILDMLKDMDFTQITPEHRVSLLNDIRVKCKNADECAAILDEPYWKPSEEQMETLSTAYRLGKLARRIWRFFNPSTNN